MTEEAPAPFDPIPNETLVNHHASVLLSLLPAGSAITAAVRIPRPWRNHHVQRRRAAVHRQDAGRSRQRERPAMNILTKLDNFLHKFRKVHGSEIDVGRPQVLMTDPRTTMSIQHFLHPGDFDMMSDGRRLLYGMFEWQANRPPLKVGPVGPPDIPDDVAAYARFEPFLMSIPLAEDEQRPLLLLRSPRDRQGVPMRFQQICVTVNEAEINEKLEEHGARGWELVAVLPHRSSTNNLHLFFKRQRPELETRI
jgi:hypothetical protein